MLRSVLSLQGVWLAVWPALLLLVAQTAWGFELAPVGVARVKSQVQAPALRVASEEQLVATAAADLAEFGVTDVTVSISPAALTAAANDAGRKGKDKGDGKKQVRREDNQIVYNGGPIMAGEVTINMIWYGDWSGPTLNANARDILNNLVDNLGDSKYYKINTGYWDQNDFVAPRTRLGREFFDTDSQTDSLLCNSTRCDIVEDIVRNAIKRGHNGRPDPNAVYAIIAAPSVKFAPQYAPNGVYCLGFCAFHNHFDMGGTAIKYAYVGTPRAEQDCYYSCALEDNLNTPTPNGNPQLDCVANNLAHELEEATSDPLLDAWLFMDGRCGDDICENADVCQFNYGQGAGTRPFDKPVKRTGSGAQYNMKIGRRKYLIQGNWVNDVHPVDENTPEPLNGYCDIVVPKKRGRPASDSDDDED